MVFKKYIVVQICIRQRIVSIFVNYNTFHAQTFKSVCTVTQKKKFHFFPQPLLFTPHDVVYFAVGGITKPRKAPHLSNHFTKPYYYKDVDVT